ncbi:unnamed protein product, partial [Rotaria sordida]
MIDKNDQRLLSSAHSAVTPRQYRQSSLPRVSRQQSIEKRIHRRKTNSAKSMIIIHTKIRSQNNSLTGNENNNVNNIDKFPSINDLVNSKSSFNQSLNEWSNNKTQSAHIKSQHSSLSKSHIDQRQIKSSTEFNIDHNRKSKKRTKRLSKSSSKDNISRGSIQFNRSSTTKTLNEYSARKKSLGEYHEIVEDTKKRKKRKYFYCFSCSYRLWCLLCLLIGLVLGILLAVLLLQFLPKSQTTITTTMSISTLLTNTSTIGSSTTTPSVTTTITSTSTTINYVCGFSCLNQSWISSTNLLAKWEFDNTLIEDVSSSLTTSDQSPVYATGYVNEALLFDANANQSLTSPFITLTSSSFTIDAWIYPTGFPNTQDHSIVGLCPSTTTYECLHLTIHENGGKYLYLGFYGDDCE